MICPKCGANVADGAAVCPGCGERLAPAQPGFYPPPAYPAPALQTEPSNAKSAQTMSIVALCLQFFNVSVVVSLVLSIIAYTSSNTAKRENGGVFTPSAKVGNVCGLLGIIFGSVKLFCLLLLLIFWTAFLAALPELFEDIVDEFLLILPTL